MKYLIIAFIIILGIFLAVLSQIPIGIEPLTEVYFENHTKLPKYAFLDQDYNFSFTINNLEHQDVEYTYTIEEYDNKGNLIREIEQGTVLLFHEQKQTFHKTINFPDKFERARINVRIEKNLIGEPDFKKKLWWQDPNYPIEINIHFWVEEIVGTTITIVDA